MQNRGKFWQFQKQENMESLLLIMHFLTWPKKYCILLDVIDALQQSDVDSRRNNSPTSKKFFQKSIVQKAPTVLFISLFKTLSKQLHRNGPQGPNWAGPSAVYASIQNVPIFKLLWILGFKHLKRKICWAKKSHERSLVQIFHEWMTYQLKRVDYWFYPFAD